MSGRARHLRDGVWITNRKTDRRQSPKRPIVERLHELNERAVKRFPSEWVPDVRVAFLLPKTLAPFVASGPHGLGVNVHKGLVQVTHTSTGMCWVLIAEFFARIAKQRPAFTVTCSIISTTFRNGDRIARPGTFGAHLTVVAGALIVSRGLHEPLVYEGRVSCIA